MFNLCCCCPLSMFENAHGGQAVWAWLKITTCSGHKKGQTSFRTHNSTINQQIGRQSAAWGSRGGRQTLAHHSSNLRKVGQKQKEPKGEFEQKVTSLKLSFILSVLQKAFLFTASLFYCILVLLWLHSGAMTTTWSTTLPQLSAAGRIKHNQVVSVMWY